MRRGYGTFQGWVPDVTAEQIRLDVEETVAFERARGHAFLQFHGQYRRVDGLKIAADSKAVNGMLVTAGRRYGNEYAEFFDLRRFPSTLSYQTRENEHHYVEFVLVAGHRLNDTRRAALGNDRKLIALADAVCGRGERCEPRNLPRLAMALEGLATYYTGAPDAADFEEHLPTLLGIQGDGTRVALHYRTWRDEDSKRQASALLYRVQGGECSICGRKMVQRATSLDHVVARSRGGVDACGNLLLAHAGCNERRGNNDPTDRQIAMLVSVNAILGWADPNPVYDEEEERRVRLRETLERLQRVRMEPRATTPKRRRASPRQVVAPAPPRPEGPELVKPQRPDNHMRGTWLRGQGVLRRNRGNRAIGQGKSK